jgi:hypothetical protein
VGVENKASCGTLKRGMEQHPIPQQISSYQFRLVGDMTLKQFFKIAGGVLVSLIIYASSLPGIIKWPLVLFFALFGIALAFLPLEERPLEQWLFAFFRSIYSPTYYHWQKRTKTPVFFKEEASVPQEKIIAHHGEAELQKYLTSLPGRGESVSSGLEEGEKTFLGKIGNLFKNNLAQTIQKPELKAKPPISPSKPLPIPPVSRPKIIVEEKRGSVPPLTAPSQPSPSPIPRQVVKPPSEPIPPLPPEKPNTVTGQVTDASGKIVEAAILEFKDPVGRPVRAVKTNKAGHFFVVTPLQNGKYEIVTEKEGLVFEPVVFEATGSIIPPIVIRAKQ